MTDKEFDDGLKAVMGDRFHGESEWIEKRQTKPVPEKNNTLAKNAPAKEKGANDQWEPVRPEPNFIDKLKQTAKDVSLFSVLSVTLFYWQQTGKLEETTAWYALLVCVGMVFFSIGKNFRGGVK